MQSNYEVSTMVGQSVLELALSLPLSPYFQLHFPSLTLLQLLWFFCCSLTINLRSQHWPFPCENALSPRALGSLSHFLTSIKSQFQCHFHQRGVAIHHSMKLSLYWYFGVAMLYSVTSHILVCLLIVYLFSATK